MPAKPTAFYIASALLERTGAAMQADDFDDFLESFSPPVVLETLEGLRLLQNCNDIRTVYESVRDFRLKNRITVVERECISAAFIDSSTIATTHIARMIKGCGAPFQTPYPAYSILRRLEGAWKITFCQYAIENSPQLNRALGQEKTPGEKPGVLEPETDKA